MRPCDQLDVVGEEAAARILQDDFPRLRAVVEDAYALHGTGRTINPPAQRLAVPGRPGSRIMSLAAHVGGRHAVAGVKWVASYPENHSRGLPRASAVLILNDEATGRPFACLEASHINAARTAASAVVAADALSGGRRPRGGLAICGAGFLARYVYRFLRADGWDPPTVTVVDSAPDRARAFASWVGAAGGPPTRVCHDLHGVFGDCELVVFATTAVTPWVQAAAFSGATPLVLHLSLRDLTPGAVTAGQNFVDDAQHAFGDGTSLALARAACSTAGFYSGSLYDVMCGAVEPDLARARIFSPFGLGILDVAVGKYVHDRARELGCVLAVPRFFSPGTATVPGLSPAHRNGEE
jgi:ornithine cyclodeaminase